MPQQRAEPPSSIVARCYGVNPTQLTFLDSVIWLNPAIQGFSTIVDEIMEGWLIDPERTKRVLGEQVIFNSFDEITWKLPQYDAMEDARRGVTELKHAPSEGKEMKFVCGIKGCKSNKYDYRCAQIRRVDDGGMTHYFTCKACNYTHVRN